MFILGLSGKARSGKDEVSKVLQETYGFKIYKFAGKVKQFAVDYFGVEPEETENKTKKSRAILQGIGSCVRNCYIDFDKTEGESGFPKWVENFAVEYFSVLPEDLSNKRKTTVISVLEAIQKMISENFEDFKRVATNPNDIWINYTFEKIQKEKPKYVLINDVRYTNEKEAIESYNGLVIRVERTDKPDIEFNAEHESETSLDNIEDWYEVIVNEHSTDWQRRLEQACGNLMRKLLFDKKVDSFKESKIKLF